MDRLASAPSCTADGYPQAILLGCRGQGVVMSDCKCLCWEANGQCTCSCIVAGGEVCMCVCLCLCWVFGILGVWIS